MAETQLSRAVLAVPHTKQKNIISIMVPKLQPGLELPV
jgi:hypothetical protein